MADKCPHCGHNTMRNNRCLNCEYEARPATAAPPAPPTVEPSPKRPPDAWQRPQPPQVVRPAPPAPLNPPPPPALLPPLSIHNQPPVVVPARPAGLYPPGRRPVDWAAQGHQPPLCEGRVDSIDGPHHQEIPPSLLRTFALGTLFRRIPFLAMHLLHPTNHYVSTCRVVDARDQHYVVSVISRGPGLGFREGDVIAVWGESESGGRHSSGRGNILLERAYIYQTNTWYKIET